MYGVGHFIEEECFCWIQYFPFKDAVDANIRLSIRHILDCMEFVYIHQDNSMQREGIWTVLASLQKVLKTLIFHALSDQSKYERASKTWDRGLWRLA